MTSVHARRVKPRRCIRPRSADLGSWGAELMVCVATKTGRYVCEIFISFLLTSSDYLRSVAGVWTARAHQPQHAICGIEIPSALEQNRAPRRLERARQFLIPLKD